MRITISEIAKLANVSKSAVSFVLNNRPGVSEETRAKVLETIKKYNYRPSHLAQSLAARETKTIGLVIKEIDNPFFAKIVKAVYDMCQTKGYSVLMVSSERSQERETEIINTLVRKRVDGLIVSPVQADAFSLSTLPGLTADNYPVVVLEQVKDQTVCSVDINNTAAAYDAVSHLISLGHRRIACLSGPTSTGHGRQRLEGYASAMSDHGIPINRKHIIEVEPYMPSGFHAAVEIFGKKKELPTALFCFNDLVAIGAMNALEKLKIRVPEDVSVMGFDDIDYGEFLRVPLTTVENPAYKIGTEGAALLLKQLDKSRVSPKQNLLMPHRLIKRKSCAKISKA